MIDLERLAKSVVNVGYHLHRELGPGLLESVYEIVMADELERQGFHVQRQIVAPIVFRGRVIEHGLRADMIVEHKLLIELKCTQNYSPAHAKQVLTYLRLLRLPLGLLINFGTPTFKEGVRRLANDYFPPQA